MKTKLISASLVLNVILAISIIVMMKHRTETGSVTATPVPDKNRAPLPSSTVPAPGSSLPRAATNFHWSQVESSDYLAYIANLRRVGCPEITIRDIIVADVNQLFAPRYAALSATALELSWWGRFDKRKPIPTELAARLRTLDAEKRAVLTRLLGSDALAAVGVAETNPAYLRDQSALGFLPESKRSAVQDVLKRHEAIHEWSEAEWKRLPSDERDARRKALREARQTELASLLTPDELRELDLRDSPTAEAIREEYGRASLTESEFRALYELRRDFEQRNPESRREDWKRLEGDYAAALGPERYSDLQRQNDSMWRAMQEMAAERGLAAETMREAHALKQEYTDKLVNAVGAMFADPQRNPQPLRDLAAEMDSRLAEILGAEAVKNLDRAGVLPRLVIQDDGQRKSYSLSRGGFSN